jgi:hypothetical protein
LIEANELDGDIAADFRVEAAVGDTPSAMA